MTQLCGGPICTARTGVGQTPLGYLRCLFKARRAMYHKPNSRLVGQTALITGSSSGIGAAVAFAMAREGANVTINYYKDEEAAQQLQQEITKELPDARTLIVQADTSKEKDVERMFAATIEEFGTVDIAVANAGIQQDAATHEMKLEQWQRVIDVNLTGQFLICRAAISEFLRRGPRKNISAATGKLICMSSVHDVIPWGGHSNYAAAKGGVKMFMQTLAQEYGGKGIRINSISPGAIATSINKEVWSDEQQKKELLKLIPYGRLGQPNDVGALAAWLASDESDYITGATLYIDGAMTNYPGFADNG